MRRSALIATLVLMGAVLLPGVARADGTYHSPPIVLLPVQGTVGGHGQVENAHANGPIVYAHEQYGLRGAEPATGYQVTLHVYLGTSGLGDPTCSPASEPVDLETALLTTNAAGNAAGKAVFSPAQAAGLPKNSPLGIVWTMSAGAGMTYESGCETVVLD